MARNNEGEVFPNETNQIGMNIENDFYNFLSK